MSKKEKIKAFVKEHKKEIIIGVGVTAISVTAGVICWKWLNNTLEIDAAAEVEKLCAKNENVANLYQFLCYCDSVKGDSTAYAAVTAEELGKLGCASTYIDENGVEATIKGAMFFCDIVK